MQASLSRQPASAHIANSGQRSSSQSTLCGCLHLATLEATVCTRACAAQGLPGTQLQEPPCAQRQGGVAPSVHFIQYTCMAGHCPAASRPSMWSWALPHSSPSIGSCMRLRQLPAHMSRAAAPSAQPFRASCPPQRNIVRSRKHTAGPVALLKTVQLDCLRCSLWTCQGARCRGIQQQQVRATA